MRDFFININSEDKHPIITAETGFETEESMVFLDGSVLNETQLLNKYKQPCLEQILDENFRNKNFQIIDEFTGEFNGWWHDKAKGDFVFFNNHQATRKMFYSIRNGELIFSNRVKNIVQELDKRGISKSLNINGAYSLLSISNLLENDTLINEIKKLHSGELLFYDAGKKKAEIFNYHDFRNIKYNNLSLKENIDQFDAAFQNAIQLEYEKDKEEESKSVATLSGGLDSRLNIFSAKKQGYSIDKTICFSQSEYLDHSISEKIAEKEKLPYQFVPLDDIDFIKPIDLLTEMNEFSVYYTGSSHVYNSLQKVNFDNVNSLHTGLIGDGILGNFVSEKMPIPANINRIFSNQRWKHKIKDYVEQIAGKYENEELFLFYNLALNRAVAGSYVTDNFAALYSPFYDPKVIDTALSIHPKHKYNHRFYIEWMKLKYPDSLKYRWETTGLYPDTFLGKNVGIKIWFRWLKYSGMLKGRNPKKYTMVPYQYHFDRNKEIRDFFQDYFEQHIDLLEPWKELRQDAKRQFEEGDFNEKVLVLTLLSSIKALFYN